MFLGYKQINSNAVSFGLAPRINACGRMGFEKEALELFLTDDIEEAKRITDRLNKYNSERQSIEKEIFEQAIKQIEKEGNDKKAIILGGNGWHHGVIGIVASKITEMYFKPSILVCFEDDIGKGSGRSIPGFDLHGALANLSKYLIKYGGHEMAVGLGIKKKDFNRFKEAFEEYAEKQNVEDIVQVLEIDKQVTLKEVKIETIRELDSLEPFGEGNRRPIFVFKNLKIDSIRALSDGKHIKLTLKDGATIVNAIGFNMGYLSEEYTLGDQIDVAGMLEINEFNGTDYIQINIKDIMKSY